MNKMIMLILLFTMSVHASHFQTGSDKPTSELLEEVQELYSTRLEQLPKNTPIVVEGHTDSRGSEAYNQKLSVDRANSVKKILEEKGFTNVKAKGLGESQLIDVSTSLKAHSKNRRVVVLFNGEKAIISECKTETIVVEKTVKKRDKNIISLRFINGYNNPDSEVNGNTGKIDISRENTLGLQYQRNVHENLYLGVDADLNKNIGLSIGVGF